MTKRLYDPKKDPLDQVEALDKAQELFLPVHGHVLLYPEEIAIVDHPSFQRLRRVRQLGMAHMVFPGATHTRFEHSIGAVHVAQMIVNHINHNFRKAQLKEQVGHWACGGVDFPTARFIRLGALLHDVGHLPIGHTLEDELGHLRHHDGNERLSLVADRAYQEYEVSLSLGVSGCRESPKRGWSLKALVDCLYQPFIGKITVPASPFELLTHIVCKKPDNPEQASQIAERFDLQVCRDIVGNTICADFLDYLFRDWHHLGKPLYHDKRLYEYMEVRSEVETPARKPGPAKFVINVGPYEKIRHDALTDILELLNARYKLAETVLFHRTKLSLTGILDRCLLEIGELYRRLELPDDRHKTMLESLLLDSSDDGLVGVLRKLSGGGSNEVKRKLHHALKSEREQIDQIVGKTPDLYGSEDALTETPDLENKTSKSVAVGELQAQVNLTESLIERLRDREVYTLGYKLRMSDFNGPHTPDNPRVSAILSLYGNTKCRLDFLRGIEARCGLPPGSVVMYCPHDARMNAKIAEVNLLIDGDVNPFDKYEAEQGDSGLTQSALGAQVKRFYELWSAYVFIERSCWDRLSPDAREDLRSVIKCFFFQIDPSANLRIARDQIDCSINAVQEEMTLPAFRASFGNPPPVEKFKTFVFPSGLPFELKS
jgi:HD superfamily phosphohydrolase